MLELYPREPRWFVEIVLDAGPSRFQLDVYAEEWGFVFRHADRVSWIRVTDIPFIHGRDDHQLLTHVPPLREIGELIRKLEAEHALTFVRTDVTVRTTIKNGDAKFREWALTL